MTTKADPRLRPAAELDALKASTANVGYMAEYRAKIEVNQAILDVLGEGITRLRSERDGELHTNEQLRARLHHIELALRVYVAFVEKLSDDTIEDMVATEIGAAARDLLAEMY